MRHKYIRTYFDLCVLVFPQISQIDAESVLFYLFNLGNLWFPCIGILNYVQNDTKPHGLFL